MPLQASSPTPNGTPRTPHPTPDTLHPTPYTLHPTPHTLQPTPYNLQPTPYTLHPTPYTLHQVGRLSVELDTARTDFRTEVDAARRAHEIEAREVEISN